MGAGGNLGPRWANFDQFCSTSDRCWPSLTKFGPSLAEFGQHLLAPGNCSTHPPRAFFEHVFRFCPAARPAGRNLASKLSHAFSQEGGAEGGAWSRGGSFGGRVVFRPMWLSRLLAARARVLGGTWRHAQAWRGASRHREGSSRGRGFCPRRPNRSPRSKSSGVLRRWCRCQKRWVKQQK